jgi:RNA polymerase sigma-70 factor (ECF subfamily)
MGVNRPTMTGWATASPRSECTDDPRPDGELASLTAQGDREAAAALVRRYHGPVRRFLQRLTGKAELADDLAQDTFVRMLHYAGHYDAKYPMRTWLLTIARRLTINHGRRESRSRPADVEAITVSSEPRPDEQASRRDANRFLRRQLDAAMAHLSLPQRQALLLFHQQGLNIDEAARVMGVPAGTVKSHLHRGRAAMRRILGESFEVNR